MSSGPLEHLIPQAAREVEPRGCPSNKWLWVKWLLGTPKKNRLVKGNIGGPGGFLFDSQMDGNKQLNNTFGTFEHPSELNYSFLKLI